MASATMIKCPKCGEDTPVPEGDDGIYLDGSEYESTCDECGAEFYVYAAVDISWSEPHLREEPSQ
jgi:rRNA maturation protein Nop10